MLLNQINWNKFYRVFSFGSSRLHLQLGPYQLSIDSLNFSTEVISLIFSGRVFQIYGPKHLQLLLPNVTVFRLWIIRSFFLLFALFLLLNNSLMYEGLKSLRLLKISKAIVLSFRSSIEHLSDFFSKAL